MRKIFLILIFLILLPVQSFGLTYTTSFPATESPISESGNWINGETYGQDWHNVATSPGLAYGLQNCEASYTDGTALLSTGTWGLSQTAQATVYVGTVYKVDNPEVELRLRSSMTTTGCGTGGAHPCNRGYEVFWSVYPNDADSYVAIVRWNGAVGDFTVLQLTQGSGNGAVTGDVVKATIDASGVIRGYKNGVQVITATDNTITTGKPGMGFNQDKPPSGPCSGANNGYGFSTFTATDSVTRTVCASGCDYTTIQGCINWVTAGNTCSVQAGTYNEYLSTQAAGTSDARITIQGTGTVNVKQMLLNHSYVTFSGFTFNTAVITNGNDQFISTSNNASNLIVSNITIIDNVNRSRSNVIVSYTKTNNSLFTNINVSNSDVYVFDIGGDNNTFSYNTCAYCNDDCFRANGATNSSWLYNEVYGGVEKGYHNDFCQIFGAPGNPASMNTNNLLFEGNYVHDQAGTIGQMWQWEVYWSPKNVHDITFRNNIFRNLDTTSGFVVPNLKWYNNVFDNVGGVGNAAIGMCDPTEDAECTGTEFKNNIVVNHGNGSGTNCGTGVDKCRIGTDYDYNYYAQGPSQSWAAVQNVTQTHGINGGNPLFTNYAGADYTLTASSPAIGQGVNLYSSFTLDKAGNTRRSSGAWDIGAYEYVAGGVTRPGGSTNILTPHAPVIQPPHR